MSLKVVARARAFLGVPFRLHGRDGRGVDCVGLVAFAWKRGSVPTGYSLRSSDLAVVEEALRAMAFRPRRARKPGDILLLEAGPAQLHLGIWSGSGLVHADAALRRVVETPGEPRWRIHSIWRP